MHWKRVWNFRPMSQRSKFSILCSPSFDLEAWLPKQILPGRVRLKFQTCEAIRKGVCQGGPPASVTEYGRRVTDGPQATRRPKLAGAKREAGGGAVRKAAGVTASLEDAAPRGPADRATQGGARRRLQNCARTQTCKCSHV